MKNPCRTTVALVLSILIPVAFFACGGGGGEPFNPVATITGTAAGTIVFAVDETGAVVAKDDTIGKAPVDNTLPARYPFSLVVKPGHRYVFYFIVGEETPAERIVPLYSARTNIFRIDPPDLSASVDFGFVDTSGAAAVAQNDPLAHPQVKDGGNTGPRAIQVAGDNGIPGIRFFNLIDHSDGTKRYRTQVQVYNDTGAVLTNGALVKGMNIYDNTWKELSRAGSFLFWNGSGVSVDFAGTVSPSPMADIEQYLAASPGTLPPGFYTVAVTDNNLNLYTSKVFLGTPVEVVKATGLVATPNPDNSVALSWTNPAGLPAADYLIYVHLVSDDQNNDGYPDSDSLLYVIRGVPTSSYTIPAEYVEGVLAGKPGLRWSVQIRQRTPAPIAYPDGSLFVAQFYRTYSTEAALPLPAGI